MIVIRLNIHEAKTHLSRYLSKLKKGETIILCKRNEPVAEIRAVPSPRTRKRPIGLAKGEFSVSKEFFEALPEELVQAFHGDAQ